MHIFMNRFGDRSIQRIKGSYSAEMRHWRFLHCG